MTEHDRTWIIIKETEWNKMTMHENGRNLKTRDNECERTWHTMDEDEAQLMKKVKEHAWKGT